MWSSVGSAGTLDPANEGKILFDGAIAQLGVSLIGVVGAPSARAEAAERLLFPRISATIRYAVTVPDGIDGVDSFKVAFNCATAGETGKFSQRCSKCRYPSYRTIPAW